MKYKRNLILYKDYFNDFYSALSSEVAKKTDYVLQIIMTEDRIPIKYFRHIEGIKDLYEIRIENAGISIVFSVVWMKGKLSFYSTVFKRRRKGLR